MPQIQIELPYPARQAAQRNGAPKEAHPKIHPAFASALKYHRENATLGQTDMEEDSDDEEESPQRVIKKET